MSRFESGVVQKPTKCVVYGPEGVGKTTLASLFPKPLFVDAEGGTGKQNVIRYPRRPGSWADLRQIVADVLADPEDRETLVFDTADWIDDLAITQVCAELGIATMGTTRKGDKDSGWGASYHKLEALWADLLTALESDFIDPGKMHLCFLAHSTTKKFELPEEEGAFDRYELAMDKRSSAKLRQWADDLFFLNYQTMVNVDDKTHKGKAQGGSRHIICTEHCAAYDAKNRDDLPRIVAFDDKAKLPTDLTRIFCPIVRGAAKAKEAPPKPKPAASPTAAVTAKPESSGLSQQHRALKTLMADAGVTYEEVLAVVRSKKAGAIYPEGTPLENIDPTFIDGFICPHWERIKEAAINNRSK